MKVPIESLDPDAHMWEARNCFVRGNTLDGQLRIGLALGHDESVTQRHYWVWDYEAARILLQVKFHWQN